MIPRPRDAPPRPRACRRRGRPPRKPGRPRRRRVPGRVPGGSGPGGANRGGRMNAEQQDQERGHQRAAADAGHADQHADGEPGQRIKRIDHPTPRTLTAKRPSNHNRARRSLEQNRRPAGENLDTRFLTKFS